jgi:hypothetical protein
MKKLLLVLLVLLVAALPALAEAQTPHTRWSIQHQPAAAAAATITRSAVTAMRHVATSVTVCVNAVAAQGTLIFNLRDGATGAGTILWSVRLMAPIGYGSCVSLPIDIPGSAGAAMTLESASAPAASNFATVALTGYDTF